MTQYHHKSLILEVDGGYSQDKIYVLIVQHFRVLILGGGMV